MDTMWDANFWHADFWHADFWGLGEESSGGMTTLTNLRGIRV
jgi:hypothetical protein